MKIAHISSQGMKYNENQDSFSFAKNDINGKYMLCVADGMGGYMNGKESSMQIADGVFQAFCANDDLQRIDNEIHRIHRRIFRNNDSEKIQSGSTVAVAVVEGDAVIVKNVGDSKVIVVGDEEVVISVDDTVANRLLQNGDISLEQFYTHPQGNVLTQAIGMGNVPQIHTSQTDLSKRQAVYVMTDGGFNRLLPGELRATAKNLCSGNMESLSQLTEMLRKRGERDDITILVIYRSETDGQNRETEIGRNSTCFSGRNNL